MTPLPVPVDLAVLDDPVGTSLRGRHAHLARHHGEALAYDASVASFVAASPGVSSDYWDDLAQLVGPGGLAETFTSSEAPPGDWEQTFALPGFQLVPSDLDLLVPRDDLATLVLGPSDVPEMLALAALTRPGPFWPRTIEMGTYLGVRDHVDGRLLAMTGERMRPPGCAEISAVCTHPEARGRGLASHLVTAVAAGILARGELPFLHVIAANHRARAVYEALGFAPRREVVFRGFRVPG